MSTYRDLGEISELLGVSPTKLRRWIDRLEIVPAVRVAHGRHLFDDLSVQLLQGIKEHLDAGWELSKLVRMFGSSSGQRLAAPPELPLAEGGGSRPPLHDELRALHQRLDQLFEEVAGVRREVAQRETEYQALMEALARMATAMSVNTAMLEQLDERLPSVLLRRN